MTENPDIYAVPDPATRRWLVKWHDLTMSLTDEEYSELKRVALDDPVEADRLAREYLTLAEEHGS
jgi:hypothetical protein